MKAECNKTKFEKKPTVVTDFKKGKKSLQIQIMTIFEGK